MTPTIGRIVHIHKVDHEPAPAIIVRVFSDTMINVRCFTDNTDNPLHLTSVPEQGSAAGYSGPTWAWPPRSAV